MRDMQCLAVEFVKMSHRSKSMQAAGLFVSYTMFFAMNSVGQ